MAQERAYKQGLFIRVVGRDIGDWSEWRSVCRICYTVLVDNIFHRQAGTGRSRRVSKPLALFHPGENIITVWRNSRIRFPALFSSGQTGAAVSTRERSYCGRADQETQRDHDGKRCLEAPEEKGYGNRPCVLDGKQNDYGQRDDSNDQREHIPSPGRFICRPMASAHVKRKGVVSSAS